MLIPEFFQRSPLFVKGSFGGNLSHHLQVNSQLPPAPQGTRLAAEGSWFAPI